MPRSNIDFSISARGTRPGGDLGLRDQLVGVGLAVLDVECGAARRGLEAGQRGLLLREPAQQIRARDGRANLALGDAVAGADVELNRAGAIA